MLREIQTEEEERVLLKDDRPQCFREKKKVLQWAVVHLKGHKRNLFFSVTVSFTAHNASLYILQRSIPWSNIHMLTRTCTHTHTHTLPHVCKSPKNVQGLLLWAGSKPLQRETQWWCLSGSMQILHSWLLSKIWDVLYFFPKIFPSLAFSLFYVLWTFQFIKTI